MSYRTPRVATCTHAGRRKLNQDAVAAVRLRTGGHLLAVADGMGGHLAGEIASRTALDALIAALQSEEPLDAAMQAANQAVFHQAARDPAHAGMGTTLVALLHTGDVYHVANVGDSRAYRIRPNGITRLTEDHSFVAEAIRDGTMSAREAARSPWRNALTRAIGTDARVEVDLFGPFTAHADELVLLCSDGLYKAVPDAAIHEYALVTEDVAAVVRSLAALAFRRGSDDNIAAAALEFGELPRRGSDVTLPVPLSGVSEEWAVRMDC